MGRTGWGFPHFLWRSDAIGDVCNVKLEIQPPRFCTPESKTGSEVRGEMLWQPRTVLDNRAAAVTHCAAHPESPPTIAIEDLRRPSVGLVKSRDDTFALFQRLVTREASRDRTVKIGSRKGILKATADSQTFKLLRIQNNFKPFGVSLVEIDGDEDPRNADFVVFECVVSRMEICIHLKAQTGMELLCPAYLEVILSVSADIADPLIGVRCIVSDEAGEKGIFDGWGRKIPIIRLSLTKIPCGYRTNSCFAK